MTKSIEKRLEKIEKAISIGKERLVVVILSNLDDKSLNDSLGPYEQWETYKQAIDTDYDLVTFIPDPQKEIEARQRIQNGTKGNNKPKCDSADGQTA